MKLLWGFPAVDCRGMHATRQWPSEGFTRPWPDEIKMAPEVKKRMDALWPKLGL
jgi:4-hydroxy-3-polyprenylbenzoate decarboxylase